MIEISEHEVIMHPEPESAPEGTWQWGALQAVTVSLAVIAMMRLELHWVLIAALTWIAVAVAYKGLADWLQVWRGGRLKARAKQVLAGIGGALYGTLVAFGLWDPGAARWGLLAIGIVGCAPMVWSLYRWWQHQQRRRSHEQQ